MRKLLLLASLWLYAGSLSAQDFTNKGKDFWLCFPTHVPSGNNLGKMSLFITSDKNSSGTISVNGFNTTFNVVANTVTEIDVPYSNAHILASEAGTIIQKGIRVKTDAGKPPVVVYAHIYANARSAASLVLPVSVLGKKYYSMNSFQGANSTGGSRSQFVVIAVDTNTTVQITPRVNGIPQPGFNITLPNVGDTYEYQDAEDLTGTLIESVATAGSPCKKIAVFSGSSAVTIHTTNCGTGGGSFDPLYQQLYPVTAWGKTYGFIPFAQYPVGVPYRVLASEPATNITINGIVVATLNAGEYYEPTSQQMAPETQALFISADKPISVAEYAQRAGCYGGPNANNNQGDPDMVLLNPIEQNVNNITVFSSNKENIATKYINVLIKTPATASFKINGAAPATTWNQMNPVGSGYSYASIQLGNATGLTLAADSNFNAIAYGFGNFESYAYSAGTNVRDLYQYVTVQNQFATVNFPAACRNSPFFFSMTFPYQPTEIQWIFGTALNGMGINDTIITSPVVTSTSVVNGRTLYTYRLNRASIIPAVGTYPITVRAKNPVGDGCNTDQEIDYDLEVFPPPTADMSWFTTGCLTDSVSFLDISNGNGRPVVKWWWNYITDGNAVDTIQNPKHKFGAPGQQDIRFAVLTDVGCFSDTITRSINLSPLPISNFTISPTRCLNVPVTFTDNSNPNGATLNKWYWDFGDATTATVFTNVAQTHTYTTPGKKIITLTVESSTGCKSVIYKDSIDVQISPRPDFSLPDVCLPAGLAQFNNQTTLNGGAPTGVTYQWNFGDGVGTSTQPNPSYNYNGAGPFSVQLIATSANGCIKDTIKQLTTIYARPDANFSSANPANEVCASDSLQFNDLSSGVGRPIAEWHWDFGDGNTSTLQNPKHKWATPGTYTVKLYIKTDKGCISDTADLPVTVLQLPTASFNVTGPLCEKGNITFTSTSNPNNAGAIDQWLWNFGAGGGVQTVLNGNPITNNYAASGSYTVTLQVQTNKGCKSTTVSQPITINPKPVANFTMPSVCLPAGVAQFNSTSTISDGSQGSFTYSWTFGDGGLGNTSNPVHNYTNPGPFNVNLEVTSNNGCKHDTTKQLTTIFAQPVAQFTVAPETCLSDSIQFTDQSSGANQIVNQWNWDFGDGNTSALQNPKHKWTTPGPKTVTLTVRTNQNCPSAVATRPVLVLTPPDARFTVSNVKCEKTAITFTNASLPNNSGNIVEWRWDFGDGTIQTILNGNPQTHTYLASGNYTVTLTVKTDKGCFSAPWPIQITVNPRPQANFTLPNVCLPVGLAQFTSTSTISDGSQGAFVYAWTFGDGGIAGNTPTPTHNYSNVGPFNVNLQVTSNNGCVHDTTKQITTIYPQPIADFSVSPEVCLGNTLSFTNTSTANRPITEWSWTFGDGVGTSTDKDPTYTYSAAGPYTVTLTVKTDVGCVSTIATKPVVVNPLPTPVFNISAPNCINQAITFSDVSTPGAGNIVKWSWDMGDNTLFDKNSAAPFTHTYNALGNYTVKLRVETNKGCISATTFDRTITISPFPEVGMILPEVCLDDPTAQFGENSTISDNTQNLFTYLWNFGDPNANAGNPNTSLLKNPTHRYAATGNYNMWLEVTSGAGCKTRKDTVFTVNGRAPEAYFTVGNELCSNKDITITNRSRVLDFGNIGKVEIYWDYNNDPTNKLTDDLPTIGKSYPHKYPTFGAPATKQYRIYMVAYSGSQCFDFFDTLITVKAAPDVTFRPFTERCFDEASFPVNGQVTELFGLPGTGVFSGPGVVNGSVFSPSNAGVGTHTITYTFNANNGCSVTKTQDIIVNPTPAADAGPDKVVLEGGSVVLTGKGTGASNLIYNWAPDYRIDNRGVPTPRVSPTDDIYYTLTVISDKGCKDDDQVFVKVLKKPLVPNAFSPNGDGINDTWVIEYLETYPGAVVEVYNRYGQPIFRSVGYDKPWDGTYKGQALPTGTYYYIINPKNGREQMTGWVVIIR
jgi:gliding motility-associated-like protein